MYKEYLTVSNIVGPLVIVEKIEDVKYAELVDVSVEDVMTDYYVMTRSAGVPPVVGPKRRQSREISIGPWIGAGVAIIVVAAAAYWWFVRDPAEPVSAIEPATLAPFSNSEASAPTVGAELLPAAEESDEAPGEE